MELSSEAWRVKCPKKWHAGKHNNDNNCSTKPHKKKEVTWSCLNRNKKKSYREPSILSLANSLNENCCHFCSTFVRYIKEVIRCVCCLLQLKLPCIRFEKLFCELFDATLATLKDTFYFVRACLRAYSNNCQPHDSCSSL